MSETEEAVAKRAAAYALLKYESPNGGSYNEKSIDRNRAQRVAQKVTGPELLALLEVAATEAVKGMEQKLWFQRRRIIEEVRRLAMISDSYALHMFIEREDKE